MKNVQIHKVLRANLPHPKVGGRVTLGPVPGTPEFELEQRCRRNGLQYIPPGSANRGHLLQALRNLQVLPNEFATELDNNAAPDTDRSGA